MNTINRLKILGTQIVADTGDIDLIRKYKPTDVTTNPSLILKVCKDNKYKHLFSKDLEQCLVNFGSEIYKEIDGYISTEVNPEYSFNIHKTVKTAIKIINLYREKGIDKSRILIKIASTWEGIKAAEILERDYQIKCNMTLIFCLEQAIECARAKVTLISPFVGRIDDWYKKNKPEINIDMGVKNVKEIYNYFKNNNINTIIMGASFRNINQIKSLAGIEKLTISPNLLDELMNDENYFVKNLIIDSNIGFTYSKKDRREFNNILQQNTMAYEKLNEGISTFVDDTNKVIEILNSNQY